MRAINPFSPLARRAFRALGTLRALELDGCRIVDAHAHTEPPAIRVDRRPSLVETYAYAAPPRGAVSVPVLCVGRLYGCRVEWHQGGRLA